MEEKKKLTEEQRERQREYVKRYTAKNDRLNIVFPAGTLDRIRALGETPTAFIKAATATALTAAEKYRK